ncbi:hypothetical protein [Streptosporangium roseum]|uniref:hypothetical protein n=1 Tax=Streptosporangium roseum TaxID=2001 RepID=UPI000AE7A0A7
MCHETVYQALYVQGRGELRRELARALRTGRVMRKPRRLARQRQPRYSTPMVMISERPAEADDPAVPGHGEGDCEHHRQEPGLGHRHPGRAHHPLRDARPPAERLAELLTTWA